MPSRRTGGTMRVEALMRDVSDAQEARGPVAGPVHQLLQAEKMAALGQTIPASRTSSTTRWRRS